MALHYWQKFKAEILKPEVTRTYIGREATPYTVVGMSSYKVSVHLGQHRVELDGHYLSSRDTTTEPIYTTLTTENNAIVREYRYQGYAPENGYSAYDVYRISVDPTIRYFKGALIETIQADYSAYTDNARNADGYWYVRGAKVNTAPNYTQIPTQSTKKRYTYYN